MPSQVAFFHAFSCDTQWHRVPLSASMCPYRVRR
nr:MAG TPA_asm: hypothetical protein [Caudoviricetes sp.]